MRARAGPCGRRVRTDTGYTATPASSTTRVRAAIVVLHPWWGLTPVITGVCDDLAELGYAAVAPDLYHGALADTPDEARRLRARRRAVPMWRHIVAEVERVRSDLEVEAVGQIGFSMGGHWALWLAQQARPEVPPVSATTVFYATRNGDFSASRSAFQFHLADTDPFVTPGSATTQERRLRAAGLDVAVHHYPHTKHWFFEWDRPAAYEPASAALAWERTIRFLDRHFPMDPSGAAG